MHTQQENQRMRVLKRSGEYEEVSFDKILNRIKILCISESFDKKLTIDPTIIASIFINPPL